jgi:hypothetical protein
LQKKQAQRKTKECRNPINNQPREDDILKKGGKFNAKSVADTCT